MALFQNCKGRRDLNVYEQWKNDNGSVICKCVKCVFMVILIGMWNWHLRSENKKKVLHMKSSNRYVRSIEKSQVRAEMSGLQGGMVYYK